MKLLFDNNLPLRLASAVQETFPGSVHVFEAGIETFSDRELWHYAQTYGYTIVSKDKDFYHLVNTLGHPPKFIWLTVGNCRNKEVIQLIENNSKEIAVFISGNKSILMLQ